MTTAGRRGLRDPQEWRGPLPRRPAPSGLRREDPCSGLDGDGLRCDLRGRLNVVIQTGWRSMTFGLLGYFGVYFLLFWLSLAAVGVQVTFAHEGIKK